MGIEKQRAFSHVGLSLVFVTAVCGCGEDLDPDAAYAARVKALEGASTRNLLKVLGEPLRVDPYLTARPGCALTGSLSSSDPRR